MKKNSEYSYRLFTEQDAPAVTKLVNQAFPNFLGGNFWEWKYESNPSFDPSLVVVAENNNQIVGCNHWLARNFKLSKNLTINVALAGDIAVNPEHRGHGVGKALLNFFRNSKTFKEKDIILTYMFAEPKLAKRLYKPAVGYVIAPNHATKYRKYLNCNRIAKNFDRINETLHSDSDLSQRLDGLNMGILFRLRGAPSFSIKLDSNKVEFTEGEIETTDVVIEGDFPFFSSAIEGRAGVNDIVKALLMRKLRVTKGKLKLLKLFNVLKLFKIALSKNSTQ